MDNWDADIAIIGAGAAGLATAIFAAEANPALNIVVLDGAKTLGAKILVSGGGRCNVTNATVVPSDFHAPRNLVQRILKRFDERTTVTWFGSLGVALKEEAGGKLFPVSNSAKTVLQALLRRCREVNVSVRTSHRVHDLSRNRGLFTMTHQQGVLTSRTVVMATGGRSLPKSGSDGQGWVMVRQLGHTIVPACPALVPLRLEPSYFHRSLSGISHEAVLTTWLDGKIIDRRRGSLLWTHVGISGPVVLDASRFWTLGTGQGKTVDLTLSCFPDDTVETLDTWLSRTAGTHGTRRVESVLAERLPARVAKALCAACDQAIKKEAKLRAQMADNQGIGSMCLGQLSRKIRRKLSLSLTHHPLPVTGAQGWNHAEVTAGGVPLQEINVATMESRKVNGLYLVGEMLDCDGRIGGFNFQWAWSTASIAGRSIVMPREPFP